MEKVLKNLKKGSLLLALHMDCLNTGVWMAWHTWQAP
jgi:hypothetical protein